MLKVTLTKRALESALLRLMIDRCAFQIYLAETELTPADDASSENLSVQLAGGVPEAEGDQWQFLKRLQKDWHYGAACFAGD